ncbi:carbon-nitrogen hydrolase [Hypomontagnella submonticulosa]|nr:carbon-nitrogen hydrolase [Hypomontagnella submonticulosa]
MAKAAIGQICSSNSMVHNLEQCVKLVGQAAAAGAKILFLPEASDYIGTSPAESLSLAKPVNSSPFVAGLRSAAAKHKVSVHVGIHVPVTVKPTTSTIIPSTSGTPFAPALKVLDQALSSSSSNNNTQQETSNPNLKLYNRTILILPDGTLHPSGSYDKLHLFDYPSAALRESNTTHPGSTFTAPIDTPVGRLGSLICFDLRFPEAALHLTTTSSTSTYPAPAQILLYPSAFTVPTGAAHWAPLLRARAIETQSYVVAAAQVGRHNPGRSPRVSYGRSMVVDPWGRVALELKGVREGEEEAEEGAVGELGVVEIDLEEWERVRARMPLVRRT